jgi:signal transduction histidine kinase
MESAMDNLASASQVDALEFLRPILSDLSKEDLEELALAAVELSYPAGAVIIHEGDEGDAVYFIVAGSVEVVKQYADGGERFLHTSGPGEPFGEMALLQEGGRTATVRAVEPSTILRIDRDPFLNVLGRSPSLGVHVLVRLTGRLSHSDQQSIKELSERNVELAEALQRLERLDKTKSDFIQVSAHELRTPVAALLGYAQMMEQHPKAQQDPGLRELTEGVVTSTKRLHRVFNSILDVSRLVSGDLKVLRSPFSIGVTLEAVQLRIEKALKERHLTMELVGLDGLPICSGDPDLIYKVFDHLVNNAIKYTPDGGRITVIGRTVDVDGLGPCIEVAIEDTGIGIAPQDIDLIFEKFYRTGEVALHSSGTTKFKGGGPGLGLAIAQGIVLAHGGRIWAESPGCDETSCPGSRFVVQLPLDTSKP